MNFILKLFRKKYVNFISFLNKVLFEIFCDRDKIFVVIVCRRGCIFFFVDKGLR